MDQKRNAHQNLWPALQTIVLTATAAGIFLNIGRRDQEIQNNSSDIAELREISQDLVKSQVLSEANDSNHANTMAELRRRIERLESNGR